MKLTSEVNKFLERNIGKGGNERSERVKSTRPRTEHMKTTKTSGVNEESQHNNENKSSKRVKPTSEVNEKKLTQ